MWIKQNQQMLKKISEKKKNLKAANSMQILYDQF